MTKEYLMHYIGGTLYGCKRFINEAKRIGVQRAIQFNLLRHVNWGETILIAEHKKLENEFKETVPTAVVFGYFKVSSISYSGLPDEVKEKLMEKLDVISIHEYARPEVEIRACGGYSIGGYCSITDAIPEVVEKIIEICKELELNPNRFKYFLKGELKVLDKPVVIYNKNFNRGYQRVQLEGFSVETEKPEKTLYFLYDYERRTYIKKEEAEQLDRLVEEEFIEATKGRK